MCSLFLLAQRLRRSVGLPMLNPSVYLAGPICGCNKSEANDWRDYVAAKLAEHSIIGISPLRCEPIVGRKYKLVYDDPKFGTPKAIKAKNAFDLRNCDITLAYLPIPAEGKKQSYGTIWEVGAAHMLNKSTIIVTDDKFVAQHPLLGGAADWCLDDLNEALDVCIGILGGYNGGKNV